MPAPAGTRRRARDGLLVAAIARRRARVCVGRATPCDPALRRPERAAQQRIEVVAGLQERGRPEVDLPRKPLDLGLDGARVDVGELDVPIALR